MVGALGRADLAELRLGVPELQECRGMEGLQRVGALEARQGFLGLAEIGVEATAQEPAGHQTRIRRQGGVDVLQRFLRLACHRAQSRQEEELGRPRHARRGGITEQAVRLAVATRLEILTRQRQTQARVLGPEQHCLA